MIFVVVVVYSKNYSHFVRFNWFSHCQIIYCKRFRKIAIRAANEDAVSPAPFKQWPHRNSQLIRTHSISVLFTWNRISLKHLIFFSLHRRSSSQYSLSLSLSNPVNTQILKFNNIGQLNHLPNCLCIDLSCSLFVPFSLFRFFTSFGRLSI